MCNGIIYVEWSTMTLFGCICDLTIIMILFYLLYIPAPVPGFRMWFIYYFLCNILDFGYVPFFGEWRK